MIVLPVMPMRNVRVGHIHHDVHISDADCARILASAKESAWQAGGVGGRGDGPGGGAGNRPGNESGVAVVPETRSCTEQRLPVDERSGFPLADISAHIGAINAETWRFELTGFVVDDMPYLMRYDASSADHYDWHVDMGRAYSASRKLGFTLQLSDGEDYSGGDLEFQHAGLDAAALRRKGSLIVFPTFCLHRVAPVTRGVRVAVVGWLHGPSFR